MNLLLFLLALSDYSSAAKPDNITLAFVSNYCSLQNVAYSSSQLINFTSYEYDQNLITPYQLSAYIYYPDVIMQMAVDAVNANPNILPQTFVNVKRFSDCGTWYPTVEADYSGYSGGYGSAMTAQDVAEQNLDVVGVIGNEYSTTARSLVEALGAYKLPYCSMASTSPRLSNKNNYPYFFRMMPAAGLGEHIRQMLRIWNVKRVAIIYQSDDDMGLQYALDISSSFLSHGITVFSINLKTNFGRDDINLSIGQLRRVSARYFILSGQQTFVSQAYYKLAKQGLVGPQFVWMSYTIPQPFGDPIKLFGPDYYRLLSGFILFQAMQPNTSTPFFQQTFNSFNKKLRTKLSLNDFVSVYTLNPAYDCVIQMLLGFDKLLKNSTFTSANLVSRSLQSLMNSTLFENLGYAGLSASPITLNQNGDLKIPFQMYFYTGNYYNTTLFGRTDMNATYFWYYPNARPIFSSGFSNPPPDGPPIVVTQEDMISSSSSNGGLVLFFAASGFVGCSAALIFVWWFRRERVVRQSSVYFLVPIVMGYMLLSVSLFTLLDRVSVAKCVGRIWLQVLGFAVIMSVLLVKVYRNGVQLQRRVTTAKKIGIKKLGWDMIAILVTVAFFELILLGLWTAAPHSTKLTSSQTSFIYTCVDPTYSHPTTIALLVANLILLCITASVAFNTEDQEFFIGEAKYPALITVTFAFTALIVLPLLATADPHSSINVSYAAGIWVVVWVSLVSIFAPKIMIVAVDALGEDFGLGSLLKDVTAGILSGGSDTESQIGSFSLDVGGRSSKRLSRGLSQKGKDMIKRDNSGKMAMHKKSRKYVQVVPMGVLCCKYKLSKSIIDSGWMFADVTISNVFDRFWLLIASKNTSASFAVDSKTKYAIIQKKRSTIFRIWSSRMTLRKKLWKLMGWLTADEMKKTPSNFSLEIEFQSHEAALELEVKILNLFDVVPSVIPTVAPSGPIQRSSLAGERSPAPIPAVVFSACLE